MKRELGLFDAVMMGLSGAIGFEIFVLLDYAYFSLAGLHLTFADFLHAGIQSFIIRAIDVTASFTLFPKQSNKKRRAHRHPKEDQQNHQ